MERTVRISPEGEITYLFHDESPLAEMGKQKIVRASNVRFDNEEQVWNVWVCMPNGTEKKLAASFQSRKKAIDYEIMCLENILLKQNIPAELFDKQSQDNKKAVSGEYPRPCGGELAWRQFWKGTS